MIPPITAPNYRITRLEWKFWPFVLLRVDAEVKEVSLLQKYLSACREVYWESVRKIATDVEQMFKEKPAIFFKNS